MKPVSGLSAPQAISSTSDRFIGESVIVLSDFAISRVESAISPRRKRLISVPPWGAIEPTYSLDESLGGVSFNAKPYQKRAIHHVLWDAPKRPFNACSGGVYHKGGMSSR